MDSACRTLLSVLIGALCWASDAGAVIVSAPLGLFVATADMPQATYNHTATLLADGRVLLTASAQSELFDPVLGTFTATGAMANAHDVATAIRLNDGRVLVTGTSFPAPYPASEVFDPASDAFGLTGDMVVRRYGASSVLLPDGRALIVGGESPSQSNVPLQTAELFDPSAGSFQATGVEISPRIGATTTVLQNGDVLVAGGTDGAGHVYATAEIYRFATGAFSMTGSMGFYRVYHAASLLPDGDVLVSGGYGSTTGAAVGNSTGVVQACVELFHPSSGTFSQVTAVMTTTRQNHSSTIQKDGSVLLAGGQDDYGNTLPYADVYNPSTQQFTRVIARMNVARTAHAATALADGRTLITGGQIYLPGNTQFVPTAAAEFFEPDDIFTAAFDVAP
ncbi:MAG: kelch repeat-containing protein [Rudaea sp.]|nr:kelch repeat-containing protein [Rudaea sp.]